MSDPVLGNYPWYYYTCDRDPTSNEPLVFNNIDLFPFFWINTVTNDFFRCIDSTAGAMIWEKEISSLNVSGFSTSVSGTDNQIIVNHVGNNYELSTPQNINSDASPNFAGMNLSSLTESNFVFTDGSKNLISSSPSSAKSSLGLDINTPRTPASISLAFNTSRRPNTTHDVFVSANILFSNILSLSDQVDIQLSPDNSVWTSFGQQKQQISLSANIINQLIAFVPAGYYYKIIRVSGSNSTINSIFEVTM